MAKKRKDLNDSPAFFARGRISAFFDLPLPPTKRKFQIQFQYTHTQGKAIRESPPQNGRYTYTHHPHINTHIHIQIAITPTHHHIHTDRYYIDRYRQIGSTFGNSRVRGVKKNQICKKFVTHLS